MVERQIVVARGPFGALDVITTPWVPCKGAAQVDVHARSSAATRTAKGEVFGSGTTLTLAGVSIAQGAGIIVGLSFDAAVTLTSVTWNALTLASNVAGPGTNGQRGNILSRLNNNAATGSVVATFSGAATAAAMWVSEYTGIIPAPAIDKTAAAEGTSTTPSSGATAATVQGAELLVGNVGIDGIAADSLGVWINSFTQGQRAAGTGAIADEGYRVVGATGAYTAAKTGISSRPWQAMIATFLLSRPPTLVIEVSRDGLSPSGGPIGGVLVSPNLAPEEIHVDGGDLAIIRPDVTQETIPRLIASAFRIVAEGDGVSTIPDFAVEAFIHHPER